MPLGEAFHSNQGGVQLDCTFDGVDSFKTSHGMATITPYSVAHWQKGYGLGAIFRGIYLTVMPLAKSAGYKVLKAGLKTGVGLASDALRGKNMSQALRHRVSGALREVTGLEQTGSNRKRKVGNRKGHRPVKRIRSSSHGKVKGQRSGHTTLQGGDIFSRH